MIENDVLGRTANELMHYLASDGCGSEWVYLGDLFANDAKDLYWPFRRLMVSRTSNAKVVTSVLDVVG